LGTRRVEVRLRVRRYFCDRKSCFRKTFVEQVSGLSERHRRSSTGLTGWLRSIAIELGGRPAARLCRRLRLAVGRTRLLRLLKAPTISDRAPRVLGVDEFAFRKGCTYGTVLVDVEAGPARRAAEGGCSGSHRSRLTTSSTTRTQRVRPALHFCPYNPLHLSEYPDT
jgi:hypothetical protein